MVARPKSYFNYIYSYPDGCVKDDGVDVSGKVFYVGKGTNTGRIDDHLREAGGDGYPCPCQKCQEIRWIWSLGKIPFRQIVFETMSEETSLENEKYLIQVKYKDHPLTNILHIFKPTRDNGDVVDLSQSEIELEIESEPSLQPSKNKEPRVSVYVKLANRLRDDIHSGKYDAYGFLPSMRVIGSLYDATPSTVYNALQFLAGEKLVVWQKGLYQINLK